MYTSIHSLPNETLVEIFHLASEAVLPDFFKNPAILDTELRRLANAPLLALSKVCSRWHDVAMNSPTLWTHVDVHCVLEQQLEVAIQLLQDRLARSRDALLFVQLKTVDNGCVPHSRIFDLLVRHSPRWKYALLCCSFAGLNTSVLKGNVPRLESLSLLVQTRVGLCKAEEVDVFEVAPRLVDLAIPAPLLRTPGFDALVRQKTQLKELGCSMLAVFPHEFRDTVSLLPQLRNVTFFAFTVNIDRRIFPRSRSIDLELPSVTAETISKLYVGSCRQFHQHQLSSVMGQIFASLTLPQLQTLAMPVAPHPETPLDWSETFHREFIAFCLRSGAGRRLTTLRLAEVRIAKKNLLEILALLEALEHLEVGDAPRRVGKSIAEMTLITDDVLRALMVPVGQDGGGLVPRLARLGCVSRLKFAHTLLVDLAKSRVASRDRDAGSFQLCIHPLAGSRASIDPGVQETLWDLAATRNSLFTFSFTEYVSYQ